MRSLSSRSSSKLAVGRGLEVEALEGCCLSPPWSLSSWRAWWLPLTSLHLKEQCRWLVGRSSQSVEQCQWPIPWITILKQRLQKDYNHTCQNVTSWWLWPSCCWRCWGRLLNLSLEMANYVDDAGCFWKHQLKMDQAPIRMGGLWWMVGGLLTWGGGVGDAGPRFQLPAASGWSLWHTKSDPRDLWPLRHLIMTWPCLTMNWP